MGCYLVFFLVLFYMPFVDEFLQGPAALVGLNFGAFLCASDLVGYSIVGVCASYVFIDFDGVPISVCRDYV